MQLKELQGIVAKYKGHPGEVLSILEEVQSKESYLPEDILREVAAATRRPLVEICGVASFYKLFTFKPRGRHLVSVCLGTACHVRRAQLVSDELEKTLGVKAGETTADREISLETVNCVGACALGPIVVADGHYFPHMQSAGIPKLVERTRFGLDRVPPGKDPRNFPVEVRCGRCNHSLMDADFAIDGHPSVRVTIAHGTVHGWVRLSSLYGSFNIVSEHEVPMDAVVHFFCPHCHAELGGGASCLECGAPMVPMVVSGGGIVQICSKRGCRGHLLDL